MDSQTANPAVGWRKFRFPLLIVAMAALMVAAGALNSALTGLGVLEFAIGVGTAAAALWCYLRLSRVVEQRPVAELSPANARAGVLRGMAIGAAAFVATMLLVLIFGGVDGFSGGSFWGFTATAGLMASVAVTEELLFRGVLFRIVERWLGTWGALALSAILFGVAHLVNPGASLWGALAIAVEAGLMLGAAYVATRTLWLPIGLHFAWNLAEGGVFGTTVSGADGGAGSLLHTLLSGPDVVTGGAFGPEASIFAVLVCAVPTVFFLRSAARRGRIVPLRGRQSRSDTSPVR
ncbi:MULTISPECIES: CPBP family intramembrane glutamic endopeptidase [Actinomycetes]|uniref:CPBP family intramembrane glutamic endopeptidase n=1 Tax=Actinomycetes TaxID=1760 RepID=UPI0001B54F79|nr:MULTISPECIES: type II CAAX endopeptidase family protein [Actinomycetes]EFL04341.1 abortive infection protein [Streptomyces sp. AA4]